MKKLRQLFNLALSAVVVALGFGSCVSMQKYKAIQQENEAAKEEINRLNAENAQIRSEMDNLFKRMKASEEYRKRMEERKVVYGPRPSGFKENIDK